MIPLSHPRVLALAGMLFAIITPGNQSFAASYAPDVDRIVLVTGQNVDSVNDYVAATGTCPGGIMSYTSTAAAEGLTVNIDYGAGNIDAQYFINSPSYTNTVIQMGLYINDDMPNILNGTRDGNLTLIGNWIQNAGRPVFLRIGYEFDGPWNMLDPTQYIVSYQYIVNFFRRLGVTNCAYVWHSCCAPTYNNYPITAWYPGDSYVDWAGVSIYQQFAGTLGTVADIDNFCAFAKSRNKPIMIAESTPYGGITDASWTNWFLPCLDVIRRHHIQMWSYISTDWDLLSLFAGQGWGDTRIETDPYVLANWEALVGNTCFLKQCADLCPRLHVKSTNCWQEAESAQLNGASVYADASASGGSAVTGLNSPGTSVTFTCGQASMQFVLRYSSTAPGTIGLYINSQPRRNLPVPATSGYGDLLVHAPIPAGASVTIQFDQRDTALNLDSILFRGYEDTDGDGLPDDWEMWRFGTLAYGPNDDPDHDGALNYQEWVADTDPMNSASVLRIGNVAHTPHQATVSYQPPVNRLAVVEQSTDLKTWTYPAATLSSNTVSAQAIVNHPPPGQVFYRLAVP